jgi:hypothetical protein
LADWRHVDVIFGRYPWNFFCGERDRHPGPNCSLSVGGAPSRPSDDPRVKRPPFEVGRPRVGVKNQPGSSLTTKAAGLPRLRSFVRVNDVSENAKPKQ